MTARRSSIIQVIGVGAWSIVAAAAGLVALFQNTPLLNRSVLASTVELDPARMRPWGGFAYSVPGIWLGLGDSERSVRSGIALFEDQTELPTSKSLHADIRDKGRGAWSHWNRVILFSTTDGSDPRTNGRRYSAVGLTLPVRLGSIVLALFAAVMMVRGVVRQMRGRRRAAGARATARSAAEESAPPADAAAPVQSRARRWMLAGASAMVSLVLVLILLVALEIFLRWRAPPPGPTLLELADGVGWRRHGAELRPIPYPTIEEPDPFRVLFAGDSFTHARSWGDRTIAALRARGIPALGDECGVSGYGTVQELVQLRSLVPRIRPAAVVLQIYLWNDPRDNWNCPAICYNPRMTQRPYLDDDGVVREPSSWLIALRRLEIWKSLLEPVLDPMRISSGRDRLAAVGIDGMAANREPFVIDYATLDTWAPLYQPSMQGGAYMTGAWRMTELAVREIRDLCAAEGVAFAIVAIDQAFTVEPAVAVASVPAPLRSSPDWDPEQPMRRMKAIAESLEVPLFDPMPALRRRHESTGLPVYDGEGMGAHLLPDSESLIAELVVPWLESVFRDLERQRLR